MKRPISLLLILLLALTGTAATAESGSSILIAYFTWTENTVVEDVDASIASALEHYGNMGDNQSGADATTSASLLAPGNTAVMASHIENATGSDLFSILVEEPYPGNYDECLERAANELDANARPALKTRVDNMEEYDVVFLGMPNWWYSCPMAVLAFVESYDFSGKTVIPFVTHGTGGISGSVRDMRRSLPDDCTVLEPIGVYRPDITTCGPRILEWLESLALPGRE